MSLRHSLVPNGDAALGRYALQANGGTDFVTDTLGGIVNFLPRLAAALLVLVIGWAIGRAVASIVAKAADRVELDRMVLETPIGRMLGGTKRAVSSAFGTLAAWFVYALAILTAADVLNVGILSRWISTAVAYLPAFVAGLLVIVLGFVVADFVGDAIERTRAATQTAYTTWFATGVRMFLYFTAVVVGLDTMGIDVQILYVVARALSWGVAAAIALGAGLAFGLGAKEYVADNIDRWSRQAKTATSSPQTDGGRDASSGGRDSSSRN